jgi:magnesium chelatase family protein
MKVLRFSARARQRILKVARTIADLGGEATIGATHIAEAVTYRTLDRRTTPEPGKE